MEPPLYLQMFIIGRKEPNPNNKYLVKLGKCCKVVCLGERALMVAESVEQRIVEVQTFVCVLI